MSERAIIEELEIDEFKRLRNSLGKKVLIVKFSAEWCKPCQKIKGFVHSQFAEMPENVVIVDIDIDETMDLYMAFKTKKMLKGVPSILAFHGDVKREDQHWYISDNSISGANETDVGIFFKHCSEKATSLL
jgi:thioredoxin 1